MDKSTRRSTYVIDLAVALTLIGLVLYVSLDVVSRCPDLAPIFYLGLETEVVATLFFLPVLILKDAIRAKNPTVPESIRSRISGGLWRFSLILAILGALVPILQEEIFMASMVFVIYPTTLFASVSAYALITGHAPQT